MLLADAYCAASAPDRAGLSAESARHDGRRCTAPQTSACVLAIGPCGGSDDGGCAQVLYNLLNNSMKVQQRKRPAIDALGVQFTKEGGVTLRVRVNDAPLQLLEVQDGRAADSDALAGGGVGVGAGGSVAVEMQMQDVKMPVCAVAATSLVVV